jgi:hypothetical protein
MAGIAPPASALGWVTQPLIPINPPPINEPPVAGDITYQVNENNNLTVPAPGILTVCSDAENERLSITVLTSTSHGAVSSNGDGSFTYTPNQGFNGQDSFTYQCNDAHGSSDPGTVTINVINLPPVVVNQTYNVLANEMTNVSAGMGVLAGATDPENDPLTATVVQSAHWALSLNSDGSFSYRPQQGFIGADGFTYQAQDAFGVSDVGTVSITVIANQPPVANNNTYSATENQSLFVAAPGVLGNATDAEHELLSAVLVQNVTHGSLNLDTDGHFTYTPNTGFVGTDSFTYQTQDAGGVSNVATATINVAVPSNLPPVANNNAYTANENGTLIIASAQGVLANATDAEHDPLTAALISGPSHGTLNLHADGSFSYTPNVGYSGADSFQYKAHDMGGDSAPATASLTIVDQLGQTTFVRHTDGSLIEHTATGPVRLIDVNTVDVSMGKDDAGNPAAFILYNNSALYEWTAAAGFHLIDANVAEASASQRAADTVFIRYRSSLVYEHTGTSNTSGFTRIDSNAVQVSAGVDADNNAAAFIVYDTAALYEWTATAGFHRIDVNVSQVNASQRAADTVFIRYVGNLLYEHTGTSNTSGFTRIDSNVAQVSSGVDASGNAAAFIVYDTGAVYEWSPVLHFHRIDTNAVQVLGSQWEADTAFILYNNQEVFEYASGVFHLIDQNATLA